MQPGHAVLALAGASALCYLVSAIAAWLLAGTLFEDVADLVRIALVFATLTQLETLYNWFLNKGSAGH